MKLGISQYAARKLVNTNGGIVNHFKPHQNLKKYKINISQRPRMWDTNGKTMQIEIDFDLIRLTEGKTDDDEKGPYLKEY